MGNESLFNLNEYRNYPFKATGTSPPIPKSVIVDFSCDIYPPASFIPGDPQGNVYLESVDAVTHPGSISFTFRQKLETVADPIQMIVPTNSPEFTFFAGVGSNWSLYFVVGRLKDIPSGFNSTVNMFVEPALTRIRIGNGITTFNIANNGRVVTTLPTNCGPTPTPPRTIEPQAAELTQLTLEAGYNASVSIGTDNKTLTVGGLIGGGLGEPCAEIPTHSGETPPTPGGPLTGGLWCNQTIKSILGVGGPIVQFVSVEGITILPDPVDPHALRIAANLRNLLGPSRYLDTSSL